jgi:hypothetical protein
MQIVQLLFTVFKDKFGTKVEVDIMFGTLVDGMNPSTWWRRAFISQTDFVKKFLIAYGLIYMSSNAQN